MSAAASVPDPIRYPIGRFAMPGRLTPEERKRDILTIGALPEMLAGAISSWNDERLDTPYRDGGWTVRQLIHHVADSHMNAYCRMRLALTENWPTIKPYDEKQWAELPDARNATVELSIELLRALHARWHRLLESLSPEQWERGFVHPENGRQTLDQVLALYDWHSRHHLGHITALANREGW
jgi:uncharacterized damage-inducible protein DinB